jgi:uncharacterized Tic20 family protein
MDNEQQVRQWAMFCHLAGLAGFLLPFGNVLGPLVLWLVKKDEHPFIDDQGKEALNFQLTVLFASLVCFVLMLVLIGFLLFAALSVVWVVFMVIAANQANLGQAYRYPCILRLVK